MKKSLLLTLSTIALASGALLASCNHDGGGGSSLKVDLSEQVAKKTSITVWIDDSKGTYFNKLKEEFAKVEKNIILKTQKVGNVESLEQLKLKGPSGNGADVVQFPHDKLAQFVSQDLALPIDGELLDFAKSRVVENALNLTKFADPQDNLVKYFALPKEVESPGLYYNKSLIQATEIPTTFEDILKKHKSTTDKKFYGQSDKYTNAYFALPYLSSFGYRPFGANGDDSQHVGFDTDEYRAGLTYLRTLKTELSIPDTGASTGHDDFTKGNQVLTFAGPWNIGAYKDAGIQVGRVPMPTLNGKKMNPFMGAQLVAIYKQSRQSREAKKFLQFLLGKEASKVNWDVQGKVPALKAEFLNEIEGISGNDLVTAMVKDIETAIPMPAIRQIEYYWGPAETALINIFGTQTDVSAISKEAEKSYKSSAKITE